MTPVPPTGIDWNPQTGVVGAGWQNWSWDTQIGRSDKGVSVKFQKGWAGVQLHAVNPLPEPKRIELKVDAAVKLNVKLVSKDHTSEKMIEAPAGKVTTIEFKQGKPGDTLNELVLQNQSPDPQGLIHLQELRLIYNERTDSILSSQGQTIRDDLSLAAQWGKRAGRSIYLGEFGAYNEGDMDSRARWTLAVRTASDDLKLDWCYWELASGFGILDPVKREFRIPLLKALRPQQQSK